MLRFRVLVLVTAALVGAGAATPAAALPTIFALQPGNRVAILGPRDTPQFDVVDIVGLPAGESAVAIDVRPATGALYLLSSAGRLYTVFVGTSSASATAVGSAFTPALSGIRFAIDFDPVADRLRVVSDTGQHLRLDPNTGQVAAVEPPLNPTTAHVAGLAYDTNHAAAAASSLYAIDSATDQLLIQSPATGGPLAVVGALGVDTSDVVGFDIAANDGLAFATLTVGATTGLYAIDLASGSATLIGPLTGLHTDVAVQAFGVPLVAVRGGTELVRFYSAMPGVVLSTTTVRGLQPGETLVGIDAGFGVGSTSRLYRLDVTSGIATPIGSQFDPLLSGTTFGVEFDGNLRLLRIVSDAGQSLLVNPQTGAVMQSGTFTGNAAAIAFLDGFDLSGLMFAIDVVTDRFTGCCGAGSGAPLGVDASAAGGFDIVRGYRRGLAVLTVGGVPTLYTIDVQSGAATSVGPIGGGGTITGLMAISPATFTFAEGSTGTFWDTDLLLANPTPIPASVVITYLTDGGNVVQDSLSVPPMSRRTVSADANTRLGATAFSSSFRSSTGVPLVAERTMRWDATGYGMHTEKAVPGAATTWYFAEGAQGFYQTYFLLTNPSAFSTLTATLRFLREGASDVTKTYMLAANSRSTIFAGDIPELVDRSFATVVTFSASGFPSTGAAERAMYFGSPIFNGGHESAGVTAPATDWFLAEGATGTFFTMFVLLSNPGATPANVTLTYFREGGGTVTRMRTIPAASRVSINIAEEDPSLAATSVATRVTSDVGVVVERSMYWPFDPASWQEAHNAFGVTETGLRWGLAEGRVGGPFAYQTFVLVANPGTTAANLTVTFLRTSGAPVSKTFTVAAGARLTITTGPGSMVPELTDEEFGTVVASDQPIFVERALYSNANNIFWAAGSGATATALP
jgi:hypothetical protein